MNNEQFQEIICNVDDRIRQHFIRQEWEQFVPNTDNEQFKAFCRHLMYVISRFLETPDKRELFIQLPVEELADLRDTNLQTSRWRDLATSIIASLFLATAEKLQFLTRGEIGEGDHVLYIDLADGRNTVRKCEILNGNDVDIRNAWNKTKCKRDLILNRQNRGQLFEFLSSNTLESLCNAKISEDYNSAALVSYSTISPQTRYPLWKWTTNWIPSPVDFASKLKEVTGREHNYDVLVVFGDKKYMNGDVDIANWYRNTRARKIIYLGSKAINGVDDAYAFSVREMFHYCHDGNINLPRIEVMRFPWLDGRKKELFDIFAECAQNDETLTESVQRQVSRKILSQFMNADFSSEKLERIKEFWDLERICNVFQDPDTSVSTTNSVYEWLQQLEFDGVNPKRAYMDAHPESRSFSRWQNYKRFVKSATDDNRSIILDNLGYHEKYDDRYSYILRYNMSMEVTSLYYEGFEEYAIISLNKFLDEDFWYKASPFREQLKNTRLIDAQAPARQELTLDDFDEDFMQFDYNEENRPMYVAGNRARYTVRFEDGTEDSVDGDVLLYEEDLYERIGIADLIGRGNCNGLSITYYKTPDNLDDLTGLPIDDINRYSQCWKNAFRRHFQSLETGNTRNQAIDIIHEACPFLSKGIIYCYSKDNPHLFLQDKEKMRRLCNYLRGLNLISEEDASYILKARRAVQIKKSFGRQLKDDILKSIVDSQYNSSLLTELLETYTREELIALLTRTKVISRINR